MFSMRSLLVANPFLPKETRRALARGGDGSRDALLRLGVSEWEAAELLDDEEQRMDLGRPSLALEGADEPKKCALGALL